MIHKKEAKIFKRRMQRFAAQVEQLAIDHDNIVYNLARVSKLFIDIFDSSSLLARKHGESLDNESIWCWDNGEWNFIPFTEWRFQYAIRRIANILNVSPRTLEECVDNVLDQGTFWNEDYDCWGFNMPPTFMAMDAVKGYRWVPLTTEIA